MAHMTGLQYRVLGLARRLYMGLHWGHRGTLVLGLYRAI